MKVGSSRNKIVRVTATGVFTVAAMAGVITPASAAQLPTLLVATTGHPATDGPNTNIQGRPPKWNPTKLVITPATGTCTFTNDSFTISNLTSKAQTVLYKTGTSPKKTLGTLQAETKYAICGSGSKGSRIKLFIEGYSGGCVEVQGDYG